MSARRILLVVVALAGVLGAAGCASPRPLCDCCSLQEQSELRPDR